MRGLRVCVVLRVGTRHLSMWEPGEGLLTVMRVDAVEEMRDHRHAADGVCVVRPRVEERRLTAELPLASERVVAAPSRLAPDERLMVLTRLLPRGPRVHGGGGGCTTADATDGVSGARAPRLGDVPQGLVNTRDFPQ